MAYRQGLDTDAVLQAAIEIADREGIEQVTLAALAGKLNVKTPSLYNHIKGLPGLKKQLSLLGLIRIKEALIESILGKSGDDALLAAGFAYVNFARKQPGLYDAITASQDLMDPELSEAGGQVVGIILRILEDYNFGKEKALHVVRGFRSMVHGFASLELRNGFQMDLDRDMSLNLLLTTYLCGLRAAL